MSDPGWEPDRFYGNCYKYRNFGVPGSDERAHLEQLIAGRQMMFASPNTFNDPYDCRPVFIRGDDPAQDRKWIGRAWEEGRIREGHPKPSKPEIERHISNVMAELSTPEGAASYFKPFIDTRTGVFCMSQGWNLLTQWAYYSDAGRGLCLEYSVNPGGGFDCVYPVDYAKERPVVQIARLLVDAEYRADALFAAVIRKAPDWAHEHEVRALQMKPGLFTHPENMLRSIMLGICAADDDVLWLTSLLRKHSVEIPLYHTRLSPHSFSLERAAL